MKEYLMKSKEHSRFFKASSAEVAAKRFLNYLRRYTKDRPIVVFSAIVTSKGIDMKTEIGWAVEWYVGPKQDGVFLGVQGEWYRLKGETASMSKEIDPDELQHRDELNEPWVKAWKKTVKKDDGD